MDDDIIVLVETEVIDLPEAFDILKKMEVEFYNTIEIDKDKLEIFNFVFKSAVNNLYIKKYKFAFFEKFYKINKRNIKKFYTKNKKKGRNYIINKFLRNHRYNIQYNKIE